MELRMFLELLVALINISYGWIFFWIFVLWMLIWLIFCQLFIAAICSSFLLMTKKLLLLILLLWSLQNFRENRICFTSSKKYYFRIQNLLSFPFWWHSNFSLFVVWYDCKVANVVWPRFSKMFSSLCLLLIHPQHYPYPPPLCRSLGSSIRLMLEMCPVETGEGPHLKFHFVCLYFFNESPPPVSFITGEKTRTRNGLKRWGRLSE